MRTLLPRFLQRQPRLLRILLGLVAGGVVISLYNRFHTYSTPCSPTAYSSGSWVHQSLRTHKTKMAHKLDVLEFAGFQGCASSREVQWHLASDNAEQWDRFPEAHSWRWETKCDINRPSSEALVRSLVEDGGWLLIGDSITEGHFFSLSCLLFPHVIATPDYVKNPYFDRAWIQNLHLNPMSPLTRRLKLPPGFDVTTTPLVTFRRVDLLLDGEELTEVHRKSHPLANTTNLFSDEQYWSWSPREYLELFTAPRPKGNYGTLVINTGGHWSPSLLSGLVSFTQNKASKNAPSAENIIASFFQSAMTTWAALVQQILDESNTERERRVIVRPYSVAHSNCHDHKKPFGSFSPKRHMLSWAPGLVGQLNAMMEKIISDPSLRSMRYLNIEMPSRLRPDAHVTGDCNHYMAGAGVMEEWTRYIWHYVTRIDTIKE